MGKHNWGNYFVAAYKGVFEHLDGKGVLAPAPAGLQLMVHGTVPTGQQADCLNGSCDVLHAVGQRRDGLSTGFGCFE